LVKREKLHCVVSNRYFYQERAHVSETNTKAVVPDEFFLVPETF
jgi:hypothetical protein